MTIHDWTRAPLDYFHHFHQQWSAALCDGLNSGRLPPGYFALIERSTYGVAPDETWLVTQSTEAEGYAARANRIAIRGPFDQVVAIIEIVSPGNKSGRHAMNSFVDKTMGLLREGINLLVIDLLSPTPRDPQGVHQRTGSEVTDQDFEQPADKRLTLAAYAAGVPVRAFVEPVGVGDSLPDMPLFLDPASYIQTPLEASYDETWRVCPDEFRERITGPSPQCPEGDSPGDTAS